MDTKSVALQNKQKTETHQVCSRCIYDSRTPKIEFDDLKEQYKTGTLEGDAILMNIIEDIKKVDKGKKYNCVIGVSEGVNAPYEYSPTVIEDHCYIGTNTIISKELL